MKSRILTLLIAHCMVHSALAQDVTLTTTFSKSTPASSDYFGSSVAAIGSNRVLIGAHRDDTGATDAGAVFLFNTNGTLLNTFTNPTPAVADMFGNSLTAIGNDGVLVGAQFDDTGAEDAGAAYLFSTAGELLATFSKPTPVSSDYFGASVAAIGSDQVLIGAYRDDTGATDAGAAFLFNTSGTLLMTVTNPSPVFGDRFGISVAAVAGDRLLIGADGADIGATDAGVAYLFTSSGALLTTFENPTPGSYDNFGYTVTAVGSDLVLIGAYGDSTGATYAGAAYIFSTNGRLLKSFTNPSPGDYDFFGYSVTAVGLDRLLIGAFQDGTQAEGAGVAYLFSTNGSLLATIYSPNPAPFQTFGSPVLAIGNDLVLICEPRNGAFAPNAGAAYLFTLPPTPPVLAINRSPSNNATISWTPNTPGFVLQETEVLSPANWTNSLSASANPTVAPATLPAKHFRLIKP